MNAIERLGLTSLERRHPEEMDNWALDRVRAMGRRVVDADATVLPPERAPLVGSVWVPSRTTAFPRLVVDVALSQAGKPLVFYHAPWLPDSALHERCALSTWHVWVRRTRAVAS